MSLVQFKSELLHCRCDFLSPIKPTSQLNLNQVVLSSNCHLFTRQKTGRKQQCASEAGSCGSSLTLSALMNAGELFCFS